MGRDDSPEHQERHAVADALPVTELGDVLPTTDHLVLVLPAKEESRTLMDARRLALLPPHAILYSVGRGHCVDDTALAPALRQGKLRAAHLDVFQQEPLPVRRSARLATLFSCRTSRRLPINIWTGSSSK
jgi:phosphoglycerate dehydrogenase-like enzyme